MINYVRIAQQIVLLVKALPQHALLVSQVDFFSQEYVKILVILDFILELIKNVNLVIQNAPLVQVNFTVNHAHQITIYMFLLAVLLVLMVTLEITQIILVKYVDQNALPVIRYLYARPVILDMN